MCCFSVCRHLGPVALLKKVDDHTSAHCVARAPVTLAKRCLDCGRPPRHWPQEIRYVTAPVFFAKDIDQETRKQLGLGCDSKASRSFNSSVRIQMIDKESQHPARGQRGLFAACKLKAGDLIIDYLGYYHRNSSTDLDSGSDYDIALRYEQVNVAIDASKMGNEARMVNDYRGIQERPNAKFESYKTSSGHIRMGIFVLGTSREISEKCTKLYRGDEILVSYGKPFWRARSHASVQ